MHKKTLYASQKNGFTLNGFTLIEVMLTLVILVIVFFPLIQILGQGLLVGAETENTSVAMSLARDKLEKLKNEDFDNIDSEAKGAIPGFGKYEREVIVTIVDTEFKDIEVKVYWQSQDGSELNVSLKTLVSGYIKI